MPKIETKNPEKGIRKPKVAQKNEDSQEDVWDQIEKMKPSGGGNFEELKDSNGFSKKDVNFFLDDDNKEADIVILAAVPYIIPIHSMVKIVEPQKGASFKVYPVKTCLKISSKSCPYCDKSSTSKSVKKAYDGIFFPMVDLRGKRTEDKDYDGDAFPKFMKVTRDEAMQIRDMIDSLKEDKMKISDVVVNVEKTGKQRVFSIKQVKTKGRQFEEVKVDTEVKKLANGDIASATIEDEKNEYFSGKTPLFSELWATPEEYADAEREASDV